MGVSKGVNGDCLGWRKAYVCVIGGVLVLDRAEGSGYRADALSNTYHTYYGRRLAKCFDWRSCCSDRHIEVA